MSLPRFFLKEQVLKNIQAQPFVLYLSPDDVKHARVLRLATGEHIAVIDADSDYFECEISEFSNEMMVSISRHVETHDQGAKVTLVQGLPKGDKLELILRHSTELGVSKFIPLACERSIVKLDAKKAEKRRVRWETVVKSAAMQSGAPRIPEVTELMNMSALKTELAEYDAVLILWEEAPQTQYLNTAMADILTNAEVSNIAIVVGPEGGLSEKEIIELQAIPTKVLLVSLGSTILRTETAGIVGPALVLYELGKLGNSPKNPIKE